MKKRMLVAGVGVLCVTAALIGPARPAQTEAAWTASQVAGAPVSSVPKPLAPTSTTCKASSIALLGLQNFTLTWTSPLSTGQQVRITKNETTGTDIQGSPGGKITLTGGSPGAYTYSAKYDTEKLLGLVNLSDLLSGTYTIKIYNGYPNSSWLSGPVTYSLNVVLLALGTSCNKV